MRKSMTRVLLLALILALLCVGAMAAGDKDTTTVTPAESKIYTVTPLTEGGAEARLENGKYVDVAKFQLTYDPAEAGEQLVMLLLGEDGVPTANNIYYIDQQSYTPTESGTCTFTIYPKQLTSGTYNLIVASQTSDKAATIVYDAAYVLGDVDNDGNVRAGDATFALRHAVGRITLTGSAFLAADVTKDGHIRADDATFILRYAVGRIDSFG